MITVAQPVSPLSWTFFQKIIFRFCVLFFGLFIFPFPLDWFSFAGNAFDWYYNAWDWVVKFSAKNIFHLSYEISMQSNGSGDTTWNYVQVFVVVVLSIVGCIIWSLTDRNRKSYNKLFYWFNVSIRYFLALSMLSYGFIKILKIQFPYPTLTRLLEPYGQSSPMGLAWTFLGYSQGYNYFMGGAEVLGGILLLFRRTTTFGALFCMTVTCNIMMINYCFDVPVKIYSSLLFLMSLYLATPEIKRLLDFFFKGRTTCLTTVKQPLTKRWQRVTALCLKIAIAGYLILTMILDDFRQWSAYEGYAPTPKLYGYFNVDTFVKNDSLYAPLLTDTLRWNKIIFETYKGFNRVTIKKMNDSLVYYTYDVDSLHNSITFTLRTDTIPKDSFFYTFSGDDMELRSRDQDSLIMHLKKIDAKNFPLTKRGFNWINEYPFNR